jgi:hypothetical protein
VLQWLVDTGDEAADAVEEYGNNNVRLLLKTMADAKWPPVPGLNLTPPPPPAASNPLVNKIKNFEELCIAYNARELYVPFRLMSAYVHPTSIGARAYLGETPGQLSTSVVTAGTLIIQTAMCLIQAGKVISKLLEGDPLGDTIAQAETTLGIQLALWSPK